VTKAAWQPARDWPALELLCDCLKFDATPADLATRIAAVGWERLFFTADERRLGSVLVRAVARLGLAPAVPAMVLPDGRRTLTMALAEREVEHLARRAAMRERLIEIAATLNHRAIVPLVLKGGRSLVAGAPDWRALQDLDLLVPPEKADAAQQELRGLGYGEAERPRPRLFHHHQRELYRPDLPGWIEIHRRGGPSRAEYFLPTAELLASATPVEMAPGARVGILPEPLHLLHGVVHHHIGHRAVKAARINPKGLYEFAAGLRGLDAAGQRALFERAARHPRLLAVLEFWVAAAADLYHLDPPALLRPAPDAVAWWQSVRHRMEQPEAAPPAGADHELRAANDAARMRRAAGGESALRRLYWRLTARLTFLKRPVPMAWSQRRSGSQAARRARAP
jgi:hypothetical protein